MGTKIIIRNFILALTLILLVVISPLVNSTKSRKNPLLNPSAATNDVSQVMDQQVKPLLKKVPNNFHIQEKNLIIPKAEASDYTFDASAVISVDLDTGEVLYEKNLSKKLPIASLTKIMTAVTALDLASEDEYFKVTDYAARQIPTRIGVVPEEEMNLKELINALLLTSANDAATVIQQGIDKKYGYPVFIKAMNEKAKFLEMYDSSFANPQGFDDPENYSTVKDLAVLSRYALENYTLISETVRKDYEFLPEDSHHKQFDLYNWNGLIGVYPDAIGMKIGNTGEAGKTTIVVAERGGNKILSAVLGAKDLYDRDLYASNLLDIGYFKKLNLPAVNVTKEQLQAKYDSWEYF